MEMVNVTKRLVAEDRVITVNEIFYGLEILKPEKMQKEPEILEAGPILLGAGPHRASAVMNQLDTWS